MDDLRELHRNHYGLTPPVAASFAEAANVCFARHHQPPKVIEIKRRQRTTRVEYRWATPTARARAAWANADDATRDGAYAVCIAAIEITEGLFAVGRTETKTGADYHLGKDRAADDFEATHRLEVSGTDKNAAEARRRLVEKCDQALSGTSALPAYAAVVSFRDSVVFYDRARRR